MAITFPKTPPTATLSHNQVEVVVNSDEQYIIPPDANAHASLRIRVVNDPVSAGNVKFFIGDPLTDAIRELTFTFHASPDDSGYQLPRNVAAEPIDDYVLGVLIPALNENYFIATGYTLAMENSSSTQAEILFTARNFGSAHTITFTENLASNEIVGVSGAWGSNPEARENFKIYLDMFAEDGLYSGNDKLLFQSDGVPNVDGDCVFAINRILDAAAGYTIPGFDTNTIEEATGAVRYFVRAAEVYGANPSPRKFHRYPNIGFLWALWGGSKSSKFPHEIYTHYINAAQNKWLTCMPDGTVVHKLQKQVLTLFCTGTTTGGFPDDATYLLEGKMFYTDGTDSGSWAEWAEYTDIPSMRFYRFRVGYTELGIDAKKEPDKTVAKYSIRITRAASAISQTFTFTVEQKTVRNPRFFLFVNSFGCAESIYMYGEQERTLAHSAKSIQRHRIDVDTADKIMHGEFDEVDNEFRRVYAISTGIKDKSYLDYFIDFVNSPERFLQASNMFSKITIPGAEMKLDSDADSTYALRLNYSDAVIERGNA